jgi:hypothetical protein
VLFAVDAPPVEVLPAAPLPPVAELELLALPVV